MRSSTAPKAERATSLASELAADLARLAAEPTLSRDRASELLGALDRLPIAAWPTTPAARGRVAARLITAIGTAVDRLDFRHRRVAEVIDQLLHQLLRELEAWSQVSDEDLSLLFDAWEHLPSQRRLPLTRALAEELPDEAVASLERRVSETLIRTNPEVSSLLSLMQRESTQASRPRDLRLLAAHLRHRRGELDEALELLAQEGSGCALCAQAAAAMLDAAGRPEEASSWLLRASVGEDPLSVRQFMFDRLWQQGDHQGALEQQTTLIEASHQGQHWIALRGFLEINAPALLPRAKELLRQRAPDAYMAILLEEGPEEEIALCAQSKAFSAERLWEIGGVLQQRLPTEAAKLYERALQMQGVAAVTRIEMTAFLERVRDITPFFEGLGRPTKAHRIARDAAAVSKCGAALKREYEHFFGTKL